MFKKEETIFYATVFVVAFVASFFRTLRDNEWRNCAHLFAIGCTSGVFAFGIISLLHNYTAADGRSPWRYLGMAALVGLLSKEQDNMARAALTKGLLGLRVFFAETSSKLDSAVSQEQKNNDGKLQTLRPRSEVGFEGRAGGELPTKLPTQEQSRGSSGP